MSWKPSPPRMDPWWNEDEGSPERRARTLVYGLYRGGFFGPAPRNVKYAPEVIKWLLDGHPEMMRQILEQVKRGD